MNDRERLIELLTQDCIFRAELFNTSVCKDIRTTECKYCYGNLADHLIANGVTVQKHGRWMEMVESKFDQHTGEYWEETYYNCMECDYASDWKSPYCPNCGAKMDLENANE